MKDNNSQLYEFVNVAFKKQTYLNILYLLFTFPLGTAYFVFLVTGLSLGLTLSIVWIGIPILILVFIAWWELASFERQLAIWLLGVEISSMAGSPTPDSSILAKGITRMKNPVTWKSLLFLFIKFPLGIVSLILAVFLIMLSIVLLMAPLLYLFEPVSIGSFHADTLGRASILFIAGVFVTLLSMHIMNLLARLAGVLAVCMLGSSSIRENKD